uniref:Adenine deaminase n=1 Tax=Candidatus Methanophaga sp. ANME-1 ERB7 TaxID=2759913 RepID=A0A7G9Z368_9EURY|nr:adenine deaminase [Methanosarcinales archaeon ANME-1 ERB7]
MIGLSDRLEHFILEIPKVELHLHLEGAIPLPTLLYFIQKRGGNKSVKNLEDLKKRLVYSNFTQFIKVWLWKNSFITEYKDFEELAYQVLKSLSQQNVKYVEAFYSPRDFTFRNKKLSICGITESLIKGKKRAFDDFGIRSELIVDIERDYGPRMGMNLMKELTSYLGRGLIGIGLGGSEKLFPASLFTKVYQEARDRGFRLTAHAGEAAGAKSIWAALGELGAERIGHGLRAYEDPRLINYLGEKQIPLEMCVVSNIKTQVCKSFKEHPVRNYFKEGLMVTINSDDPTMFDTSITNEYLVLIQKFGFNLEEIRKINLNSIQASFMTNREKDIMKEAFNQEWKGLISKYFKKQK